MNINIIVAQNIFDVLEAQNKNISDLALAMKTDTKTVLKMLYSDKVLDPIFLTQIAGFLNVNIGNLFEVEGDQGRYNVITQMKTSVNSESARNALDAADELAGLCIFHARVRENAEKMMKPIQGGLVK